MDSIHDKVKITEGLGDCLIAAEAVSQYGKKHHHRIRFATDGRLVPYLHGNSWLIVEDANTVDTSDYFHLKWASQLNNPEVFNLHTIQRFSVQLGFLADPEKTIAIHDNQGNWIYNDLSTDNNHIHVENTLVINQYSAEKNRRYLHDDQVEEVIKVAQTIDPKIEIKYVGDNHPLASSECDIDRGIRLVANARLFVGPISFWYHLACAVNTRNILFTSYMPASKFSNGHSIVVSPKINTATICSHMCEREEQVQRELMLCRDRCRIPDHITHRDIGRAVRQALI